MMYDNFNIGKPSLPVRMLIAFLITRMFINVLNIPVCRSSKFFPVDHQFPPLKRTNATLKREFSIRVRYSYDHSRTVSPCLL